MAAPPAEAPWTTDPEVEKYLSELPSGYRFRPTDGELVVDYLRNKILDQVADDYVLVKIYHKNMMKSNFSIPAPQVLQQDPLQDNNAVAADHQQEDNDKALVPITIVAAESHHNQDSDEGMEEYHHNNMNNNSSFAALQVPDYNDEDFIEGMNLLILHQDNEGMINLFIHQQEEAPLLLLPNDHHQHHPQDDSGKNDDGMNNHQEDKSLLPNAYAAAQSSSSSSSSQYNDEAMMNFLIQQEEIKPTLPNTSPTLHHHQHEHDDAPNDHLHYLLNDNREAQHQHPTNTLSPCIAQDYMMLSDFASGDERLQVESSAPFPTSPIRYDDDCSYPLEDFCDIWSESYHQDLMFAPQDAAYDAHYYHELDNNNKRQRLI
ncbi:unnamed protein product [Cuscuta campestris]|uniref:Uncharacterized protein n=1 Tax=Cuscuta campestris TaxID=132261 RepID=A0A484LRQ8_9ASTE|nr:unnamed protein product [Cuscuta campestris]